MGMITPIPDAYQKYGISDHERNAIENVQSVETLQIMLNLCQERLERLESGEAYKFPWMILPPTELHEVTVGQEYAKLRCIQERMVKVGESANE